MCAGTRIRVRFCMLLSAVSSVELATLGNWERGVSFGFVLLLQVLFTVIKLKLRCQKRRK
jgi:hypothetical protein